MTEQREKGVGGKGGELKHKHKVGESLNKRLLFCSLF